MVTRASKVTTPKTSEALVFGVGYRRVETAGKTWQPRKRVVRLVSGLGGKPERGHPENERLCSLSGLGGGGCQWVAVVVARKRDSPKTSDALVFGLVVMVAGG